MRLTLRTRSPSAAALLAGAAAVVAVCATRPSAAGGDDPLRVATAAEGGTVNPWCTIPPMCYTRTDGVSNPCWTCHTGAVSPNDLADWQLQREYSFTTPAKTNPWTNLFADRTKDVAAIGDAAILAWVRQDNFTPLREALAGRAGYPGYVPDLDFARGFDEEGFAKDGSGWRAVRYKPFPGTFWPTNGSADDTAVRLPAAFRRDAAGKTSRETYKANLAILEASIAGDPFLRDADVVRDVEPIDETVAGVDLDRDGKLSPAATRVVGLPAGFVGGARDVPVVRRLYPEGTEFLHSVRYLDPDAPALASVRMKELRYSKKERFIGPAALAKTYKAARDDDAPPAAGKPEPPPPSFEGTALTGLSNDFGWRLQAFIEDAEGRLRLQTRAEHLFCMGCHTDAGVTVDQTFAFPRKVPGAPGWRPQDLRGMKDVPQARHALPEVLTYFQRVGAGDEFRGNREFADRFAPGGALDAAGLLRAAPGGDRDLAWLLAPSRERALALDKAYLALVRRQTFANGRDATAAPATNVLATVTEKTTGLEEAHRVERDGKLHLDWAWLPAASVRTSK